MNLRKPALLSAAQARVFKSDSSNQYSWRALNLYQKTIAIYKQQGLYRNGEKCTRVIFRMIVWGGYNNTFQDCKQYVHSYLVLFILQIYSSGSSWLLAVWLVALRRKDAEVCHCRISLQLCPLITLGRHQSLITAKAFCLANALLQSPFLTPRHLDGIAKVNQRGSLFILQPDL